MVCGFEDAGFEIKDQMVWIYSQGFPKSYNISKGFDKRAGAEREVIGQRIYGDGKTRPPSGIGYVEGTMEPKSGADRVITAPTTDLAKQWDGWGTALKPTHEPIMVAQKPIEGNYCDNVIKWGVGGLNIDGNRIELNGEIIPINVLEKWSGFGQEKRPDYVQQNNTQGRFPANTIFDKGAGEILNNQVGILKSGSPTLKNGEPSLKKSSSEQPSGGGYSKGWGDVPVTGYGDSGGASRFFHNFNYDEEDLQTVERFIYCAKASKKDRTENGLVDNTHVTVKPTELMKHLIKLVTPPNGINIDICEGSGSSAKACAQLTKEGYPVEHIGVEYEKESYDIAVERLEINLKGE
jgi:site-specific DNA-methyltransferase (adenine-specific)